MEEEANDLFPWGLLTMIVKRGIFTKKMDMFSLSDPYVKVNLDGVKVQTHFVQDSHYPTWNQRFFFVVGSPTAKTVEYLDK